MDFLRNLFGNLTATIFRLIVVVGTMAAVYFFAIRPVLDTTEEISNNTNRSIQQSFQQGGVQDIGKQINKALNQSQQQGNGKVNVPGSATNISIQRAQKLLACIQRVQPNVQKMANCQQRFQP